MRYREKLTRRKNVVLMLRKAEGFSLFNFQFFQASHLPANLPLVYFSLNVIAKMINKA